MELVKNVPGDIKPGLVYFIPSYGSKIASRAHDSNNLFSDADFKPKILLVLENSIGDMCLLMM